ncbi:MAG: DNA-formamidopyrimidine glycosylase family protein, partial [Actinocatenispora sp.]
MPELPDVEGFRRVLADSAQRRRVRAVEVYDRQIVHGATLDELSSAEGRRVATVTRRGKWLIVPFSPVRGPHPVLLMHFGMTGSLLWVPGGGEAPGPHDRADLVFTAGRIRYRDQRKLKGWWWARSPAEVDDILGDLGPDAGTVDAETFAALLTAHRRGVKSALLAQSVLAGLGNLLTDEILWQARIHPARSTRDLTDPELERLHATMRRVLRDSVPVGRVPDQHGWLTGRRDAPDPHCTRCG